MIGKRVVSSSMIGRVVEHLGRRLYEIPVGFKWFASGLFDGSCPASCGATGRLEHRPGRADRGPAGGRDERSHQHYAELTEAFGNPRYRRIDVPAAPALKAVLARLSSEAVAAPTLAGEPISDYEPNRPAIWP